MIDIGPFLIVSTLFAHALAVPIIAEDVSIQSNAWGYGTGGGILGLIVLILDIIVFLEVLKSSRPPVNKLLWCLLVFFFPIGGLIIYYLFSDRARHNSGSYEAIP